MSTVTAYQLVVDGETIPEWIDAPDDDVASAVVSILAGNVGWEHDGRRGFPSGPAQNVPETRVLHVIQHREAEFVEALRSYRSYHDQPSDDAQRFQHRGYLIARFLDAYAVVGI